MPKIVRIIMLDVLRSRFVLLYALLLAGLSWSVFSIEDNAEKGLLSLLNLVLLTLPLVSVMYATSYLYNSAEFIELLLGQPVKRTRIWLSLYTGVAGALCLAFLVGTGIPLLVFAPHATGFMLLACGLLLTLIFVALAMLSGILTRDKARGIGLSILLWLFFALLFDGLVLFLLFQLSDYPIEKMMIGLSMLNPIALARILILLHLDVSAMMGYTGAIFKDFFGTSAGMAVSFLVLLLWTVVPFWYSLRRFLRRDL